MELVEVPVTSEDMTDVDGLAVSHRRLRLRRALEPGQVLVVRTLDGRCRGGVVDSVEFTATDTVYHLGVGTVVDHCEAGSPCGEVVGSHHLTTEDVRDALEALRTLINPPTTRHTPPDIERIPYGVDAPYVTA